MKRAVFGIIGLAWVLVLPWAFGGASAADVSKTLVASAFAWHDGSASGTSPPTFTVTAGDVLRLTIIGDTTAHTFTLPHFAVDDNLAVGQTIFVNITTSSSDVGTWQFHCTLHSAGSGENWTGMIGHVQVTSAAPPPPKTPGFEVSLTIGALAAAFLVVALARAR